MGFAWQHAALLASAASAASIASLNFRAPHARMVATGGVDVLDCSSTAADAAFDVAVADCEACLQGQSQVSLAAMPRILSQIFDLDFELLCAQHGSRTLLANVTCLCPREGISLQDRYDEDLVRAQAEHTVPGRQCAGGACSSACSRVSISGLASAAECEALEEGAAALMPSLSEAHEDFHVSCTMAAEEGDVRTALLLLRLVERLRRAVAHEYGLPLDRLVVQSHFVNRVHTAATNHYRMVHADESSLRDFHYSAVLHLASQSSGGFGGGDFVFSDLPQAEDESARAMEAADEDRDKGVGARARDAAPSSLEQPRTELSASGRRLTRLAPVRGRALLFSSGWENVHYVESVTHGARFALPVFFRTLAAQEGSSCAGEGTLAAQEQGSSCACDADGADAVAGKDLASEICAMWTNKRQGVGQVAEAGRIRLKPM